ncbi:hypothetical protein NKH34_17710 [Mesorhizobium sp. M1148]|uniref:hypothetical protein n=1 Tax=unclassified Mesorhizobium TaxID=325217 RepID=UPI003338BB47
MALASMLWGMVVSGVGAIRRYLENLSNTIKYAVEVFVVTFFGFLPLFALALRKYTSISGTELEKTRGLLDIAFSGGQLYLYVFSLFGTLMWIGLFDWHYVYGKLRLFFIFIIVCLGFFIFGLANFDPSFERFGERDVWVIHSSYYIFGLSLILYYLLLVFREAKPPELRDTLTVGAENLARDLKKLDEGGDK